VKLTEREEQVLDALAVGLRDKEIAWRLGISQFTVASHIRLAMAKLNARTRIEAVVIFKRQQIRLVEISDTAPRSTG
jgi:two-component system nitrate/nitrite response regulator NarL